MCFLKFCFAFGLIIFLGWKIAFYIGYRYAASHKDFQYAPMKWSMVKKLYVVKPQRFKYGTVAWCATPTHFYEGDDMRVLFYEHTPIMLSFFGYQVLRIKFFMYLHNKASKQKKDALVDILETAQLDIDHLMDTALAEQKQGKDMIEEILKEWKK